MKSLRVTGLIKKSNDRVSIVLSNGSILPYFHVNDPIIKELSRNLQSKKVTKIIKSFEKFKQIYTYIGDEFLFKFFIEALKNLDNTTIQKLYKFANRLKENPNKQVLTTLYEFLSSKSIEIDDNGYIIAYKAVRNDFYDIYSGTVKYEIGKYTAMNREDVDPDPMNPCSIGLHVGTLEYAKNYGGSNSIILKVLIDPKDVVSVPIIESEKMRVCKLKPIEVVEDIQIPKEIKTKKNKYVLQHDPIIYKSIKKDNRIIERLPSNIQVNNAYYLYSKKNKKNLTGIMLEIGNKKYYYKKV